MPTHNLKLLGFLIVLFSSFSVAGCYWERPTEVGLGGESTPIFVLSGSGNLSTFSVYLVSPSDFNFGRTVDSLSLDSSFTQPAVWRIEAQTDGFHGRSVES